MIGLAIRLALGGFGLLKGVAQWLVVIADWLFRWLRADWRNPLLAALAGCCLFHLFIALPGVRHERDRALAQRDTARAAFDEAQRIHRAATVASEQLQASNLARVRADQAAISERTSHDLEARLADLRSRAERLRQHTARAGGLSQNGGLSALPTAARGAAEGTGSAGLPSAFTDAFQLELRLAASENTEQLIALQEWTRAQAAVRVSPVSGPITGREITR